MDGKSKHGKMADESYRLCLVIPKSVRKRIMSIRCRNENFSDAARMCLFTGLETLEQKNERT